ncbi:MAG TPA: PEP/pyruvate-binding domain-containing protein [Actinomycetota bacterium]|nr:PEP/pyruvate-binding domain-containing protein [Actinomycetota bacterium]
MSAVPLDAPAARDPAIVGVKAAGLAAAANAGLPVLPGWILPLEASTAAITAGARALENAGRPTAYLAAMEFAVPSALPSGGAMDGERGLFVVRSSTALDDDGRWSGGFASYVGIEPGDLPTAVRGCWASAFSGDALGRCAEAGVDVDTLRIAVLVQPFIRLDAGGTARVRDDGAVDVSVAPGGPSGVVAGRRDGRDVRVGADGRIVAETESSVPAATVSAAAGLARRASGSVTATPIEWGAVGDEIYLLQIGPARPAEAPSADPAPHIRTRHAPVPAGAERLARLVTAFPGPLGDALVLPWALGAGDASAIEGVGADTVGVHDPASALVEARALADEAAAEVWGAPPPLARERAADVMRLLLRGGVTDGVRAIARLGAPDPDVARRIVALVRAVGELLAGAGLLPSPKLVWRLTGEEVDRAIAGTPPALRGGPGRWEPFVAEVVRARGRGAQAVPVSPGIGAGPLRPLRRLRSLDRPGPREVLVAPLPLPHLAPLLWHSAALVTAGGTAGAHLFEVARSLGVPAVIGPGIGPEIGMDAQALGESGSLVAVDGDTGRVSILPKPAAPIVASPSRTSRSNWSDPVAAVPAGGA